MDAIEILHEIQWIIGLKSSEIPQATWDRVEEYLRAVLEYQGKRP